MGELCRRRWERESDWERVWRSGQQRRSNGYANGFWGVPRSLDDGSFSDLNSSEVQGAEWGPSSLTKKRSRETSKATRLHSSITHPTHPEHAHGQLGLVLLPHRPKIDPVRIGVVHARREVKTQSISGGSAQDLLGMLGGGI